MSTGHVQDQSGYAKLTRRLASQALTIAIDAAPHRAPLGEQRWAMAKAMPAARLLIGLGDEQDRVDLSESAKQFAGVLADPAGKVTDGFGHTRPVYAWLAMHLLGSAAKHVGDQAALDRVSSTAGAWLTDEPTRGDTDPRLTAWRRLVACEHELETRAAIGLRPPGEPAPLMPLGVNDLIDAWTYRELVGVHGLHLLAALSNDAVLADIAGQATLYHLGHTQPDYTTYQPWGLAAFASDVQTSVFAEQQLHDVATHLSIEGPGSAVLPALLLADAAAVMDGTLGQAWNRS